MWWSWVALGCGSSSDGGQEQVAGELDLSIDPGRIDFATVALGDSAEQSITMHNEGSSAVLVAEVWTSDPDAVKVTAIGSPTIRPGSDEPLTVQWTPYAMADLEATLYLRVGTDLDALSRLDVPLLGTVSGAMLGLSDTSADVGRVTVGCTETFELIATNAGNEELSIEELRLTNPDEFALEDGAGAQPTLPIHLAPGDSVPIDVVYIPEAEHSTSTTLEIRSNDGLAPVRTVQLEAEGWIQASNTMQWTVEAPPIVTAVINVNEWVIDAKYGAFRDDMSEFLPVLFAALEDAEVPYRLAIVMNESGAVTGNVAFIDDSFSVDDAVAAANDMLEGRSSVADNDQGLATCFNAIEANADWLLDGPWLDSRLNLLVINGDAEQSPGDATHYVELYSESKGYADGTGDFAVHGIAGDPRTGGCGSPADGEFGVPSPVLWDATDLTGGVFISICDDWIASVPALVDGFAGEIQRFVLDYNPAAWSLEVRIDGAEVLTGWTYDAKTKELLFDAAARPPVGAELRVDYIMAATCDE